MKLALTLVEPILTEWSYYNAERDMEKNRLENTALAGGDCDLSECCYNSIFQQSVKKMMNKPLHLVAW